jgi:hypothetical protein
MKMDVKVVRSSIPSTKVLSITCTSVQKLFGLVLPSIHREQILNALQDIYTTYT